MKEKIIVYSVLIQLFILSSCVLTAQDLNSASEYNNEMIKIQVAVDDAISKWVDAMYLLDLDLMIVEKENTLKAIKKANKDITAMEKFDGNEFKKEMKAFLKMYKEIADNELTKILNLIDKKAGNLSDTDWDEYNTYYDNAIFKYNAAFDRFNEFQSRFASKWGFTIVSEEE